MGLCTRFLTVMRPGPADGVGVGVTVGVAVGVGVGVGDGPPLIQEYKSLFGDVVSMLVMMPDVAEPERACVTDAALADGLDAR